MTPETAMDGVQATNGNPTLQLCVLAFLLFNIGAFVVLLLASTTNVSSAKLKNSLQIQGKWAKRFLTYELLAVGAVVMLMPFYWMLVTAFKDAETASKSPPVWTPSRVKSFVESPETGEMISVVPLETRRETGQEIRVVPDEYYDFKTVEDNGVKTTREVADVERIFRANPDLFELRTVLDMDLKNFRRAWYRPEAASRGEVNFLTYFTVSIISSSMSTAGALITSAFAAFAFARLIFAGKTVLFYIILATMMVPGQVLLIPNFLILSQLGWLDTYLALVVPWLASVFTIFLMRQFFMTIPEDLWDASRIDGASRFRFLWQIVVPLSKPVFITAGIFDFLNNWNSLLWPLIVTSTPSMRTLMVGLQNLNDDAGTEFHILMAASCFAIVPVVIVFFFLQKFFIEGIARTGLK